MTVELPDGDAIAITTGPPGPQGPSGLESIPTSVKTASYTVSTGDGFLIGDATAGAITFTLPAAADFSGRQLIFKKSDSSINVVVVAAVDETIDGSGSYVLSYLHQVVAVISDGSNWQVVFTNYGGTPIGDVLFDAVGAGFKSTEGTAPGGTPGPDPSWSHAVAGDGIVVFFTICANGAPTAPTAAAFVGETEMTQLGDPILYQTVDDVGTTDGWWEYAFGLVHSPAGDQTITITAVPDFGATRIMAANSMSFFNVSGFGTPVTATDVGGAGHEPSISATAMPGQMIAQGFSGVGNWIVSYNRTSEWVAGPATWSPPMVIGYAAGSGFDVEFTASHDHHWAGIAVPIL